MLKVLLQLYLLYDAWSCMYGLNLRHGPRNLVFSTDKIKTCRSIIWDVEIEIGCTEGKWMEISTSHIIDLEVVFFLRQCPLNLAKSYPSNFNGQIR